MKKSLLMLLVGLMAMGASMKAFASARLDGMGSNLFVNGRFGFRFLVSQQGLRLQQYHQYSWVDSCRWHGLGWLDHEG